MCTMKFKKVAERRRVRVWGVVLAMLVILSPSTMAAEASYDNDATDVTTDTKYENEPSVALSPPGHLDGVEPGPVIAAAGVGVNEVAPQQQEQPESQLRATARLEMEELSDLWDEARHYELQDDLVELDITEQELRRAADRAGKVGQFGYADGSRYYANKKKNKKKKKNDSNGNSLRGSGSNHDRNGRLLLETTSTSGGWEVLALQQPPPDATVDLDGNHRRRLEVAHDDAFVPTGDVEQTHKFHGRPGKLVQRHCCRPYSDNEDQCVNTSDLVRAKEHYCPIDEPNLWLGCSWNAETSKCQPITATAAQAAAIA